jgi:hypothetical protein
VTSGAGPVKLKKSGEGEGMRWRRALGAVTTAVTLVGTTRALLPASEDKSEAFEPPKYITGLIAAINDGAKAAQTGVFAFSLVGLYLVASARSTTDEDLLLGHTTSAYQLGVEVPVIFTFAIAPFVFLGLHLFILVRYDMLAANLRYFCIELDASVKQHEDRERCRQLLANVEFVIAQTAPRGSPLHNWIFCWVWFVLVAMSPVVVLLVVQARALRYQSSAVVIAERVVFVGDLLLLVWFFSRQIWAQSIRRGSTYDVGRYLCAGGRRFLDELCLVEYSCDSAGRLL